MSPGLKSKVRSTASWISSSGTLLVRYVSTYTLSGSGRPMPYDTCSRAAGSAAASSRDLDVLLYLHSYSNGSPRQARSSYIVHALCSKTGSPAARILHPLTDQELHCRTCTRQRCASPAATTDLAACRAMYAPLLSTLVGSLPLKAPPPCAPQPPYVSTMILRPVRPASPKGPPRMKLQAVRPLIPDVKATNTTCAESNK
jgi:hypothetical protein